MSNQHISERVCWFIIVGVGAGADSNQTDRLINQSTNQPIRRTSAHPESPPPHVCWFIYLQHLYVSSKLTYNVPAAVRHSQPPADSFVLAMFNKHKSFKHTARSWHIGETYILNDANIVGLSLAKEHGQTPTNLASGVVFFSVAWI